MPKIVQKQFGLKVSTSLQFWATVGGKQFYARSVWEHNIACYLQFLKEIGQIQDWEHEPVTFYFEGIKRGVVSYLPDFRITAKDGEVYFIEVKGFMDSRSKTKITRFHKYYPQYRLEVISKARYYDIAKNKAFYKGWIVVEMKKAGY